MTTKPNRRVEKAAATRARLVAIARDQFRHLGYEAVTIRGVAKAAGLSTGAVFCHWKGKDELFAEVMGRPPFTDALGARIFSVLSTYAPGVAADLLAELRAA